MAGPLPFTAAGENIIAALTVALEKGAHEIMAEADFLIPKDTMTARESARVLPVEDEGTALSERDLGQSIDAELHIRYGKSLR